MNPDSKTPVPLDYAPPNVAHFSWWEFAVLITLTLFPIVIMLSPTDNPREPLYQAVWIGLGSVLPWRFAFRGYFRWWAGAIAFLCSLLALSWFTLWCLNRLHII